MPDSRQKFAAHAMAGRADLDHLLRARDRSEIARLMCCLLRWHREMLPLAEAYDPAMVAYLKPVRPKLEELIRIWGKLNKLPIGRQRGLCNATEAALVRINDALMQRHDRGPVLPTRKHGELGRNAFKVYEEIIIERTQTFERGELTTLAREIAERIGCSQSMVEKTIRADYKKLKEDRH